MKVPHTQKSRPAWTVLSFLLVSLLLRWLLILRGGQYYIADETRYEVSRDAARFVTQGQLGEALRQFTISPEHLAFKVVGIIPALVELVVGPSLVLPAIFFSFFSILNIYLIYLLSQRGRASANEPVYALFFAASCLSLLYYSRHLFPYDMAMSFGLLALYLATIRPQNIKTSLACGGLSFLCFITYNGYWALAGFAMVVNMLPEERAVAGILKRAMWTSTGFIAPFILLLAVLLATGTNMISALRLFAASITQGTFEEGWSLPFVYLWHTEHLTILVIGLLSAFAAIQFFRTKQRYAGVWIGGIIFIYLCLFIPSVLLHSFVVYGRLTRQLLPFLILLSAHGLALFEERKQVSRSAIVILLAGVLIQAAWNFKASYQLSYPRQFSETLQAQFGGFEFSTKRLAYGAPTLCQSHGYVIENTKYFLSAPETTPLVRGELLRDVPHPVNFLPYQYEGYTPQQRQEFRGRHLRMRFYKGDEEFLSNPENEIKNCAIQGDQE